MLVSKSSSTSLKWNVPFKNRINLLDCANVQLEQSTVENFVNCNDSDIFRNKFRKFIKKQISECADLKTAIEIEIVLSKLDLKISQFAHLSDNTSKVINLITSAKIEAQKIEAQKIASAKQAKVKK